MRKYISSIQGILYPALQASHLTDQAALLAALDADVDASVADVQATLLDETNGVLVSAFSYIHTYILYPFTSVRLVTLITWKVL